MIIDASAIFAIVFREDDRAVMLDAMSRAERRLASAARWLGTFIVFDRRKRPAGVRRVERLLALVRPEIVAVAAEQASVARTTCQVQGDHPAKLNHGDRFAYAPSKLTGEPLPSEGNDFNQTDIQPALT